jgi:hypothetical protein
VLSAGSRDGKMKTSNNSGASLARQQFIRTATILTSRLRTCVASNAIPVKKRTLKAKTKTLQNMSALTVEALQI